MDYAEPLRNYITLIKLMRAEQLKKSEIKTSLEQEVDLISEMLLPSHGENEILSRIEEVQPKP